MLIPMGAVPGFHAQQRGPQTAAVRQGEDVLSWGELDTRSTRRAWALKDRGVAKGDFVTLALANGIELFEWTFSIWKLGATPHLVSCKLPAVELQALLELAQPKAVVGTASTRASIHNALPTDYGLVEGRDDPLPEAEAPHWKAMSSGGSTGRPKIIVDHKPGVYDTDSVYLRVGPNEVVLNPGPLYHNAPFSMSHNALFKGNQVVGMDRFDGEEALRLIDRWKVTSVNFVPTMMLRIWRLPQETKAKYDISSLRNVWHMAAPMPAWLKLAWIEWIGPEKINEAYAGTEQVGSTVINGVEWLTHQGSVGRPRNSQIRILDEQGKELPSGAVGEIYFKAVSAQKLYHYIGSDRREAAGGDESLGDFGWLDEEGYLYLADRRTDLIVSGGANIYPAEIESALMEHPGVQVAVVVGLPHEDLGAAAHAIIQRNPAWQDELTADILTGFLKDRLVKYKLPRSFEFVATELRDEGGKVRRSQLREERMAASRPSSSLHGGGVLPIESKLKESSR